MLLGVGLVTLLCQLGSNTKWLETRKTFEWFYTAGRNAKTDFRPKIYRMHVMEWSDMERSVDESLPTQ